MRPCNAPSGHLPRLFWKQPILKSHEMSLNPKVFWPLGATLLATMVKIRILTNPSEKKRFRGERAKSLSLTTKRYRKTLSKPLSKSADPEVLRGLQSLFMLTLLPGPIHETERREFHDWSFWSKPLLHEFAVSAHLRLGASLRAVSYTHLTLPTIYSV